MKKTNRRMRFFLMPLLIILYGCAQENGKEKEKEPLVSVTKPEPANTSIGGQTYLGRVAPSEKSTLSFQVSGTIKKRAILIGQSVKKGELLFEIDNHDYVAADEAARYLYRAAVARFESAHKDYQSSLALYKKHFIAEPDLKRRHAQLLLAQGERYKAQAAYVNAENRLAETHLLSPYEGTITAIVAEKGQNVAPGTPVAVIGQNNQLDVAIDVAQQDISSLATNQPVGITINKTATHQIQCAGNIHEIGTDSSPLSTTYPVVIRLKDCPEKPRLGMLASVHFPNAKNSAQDFLVPESSVGTDNQGAFILTIDRDSVVHRQSITLNGHNTVGSAGLYIIKANGLSTNTPLVTGPIFMLHDGQKVQIDQQMNDEQLDQSEKIGVLS